MSHVTKVQSVSQTEGRVSVVSSSERALLECTALDALSSSKGPGPSGQGRCGFTCTVALTCHLQQQRQCACVVDVIKTSSPLCTRVSVHNTLGAAHGEFRRGGSYSDADRTHGAEGCHHQDCVSRRPQRGQKGFAAAFLRRHVQRRHRAHHRHRLQDTHGGYRGRALQAADMGHRGE